MGKQVREEGSGKRGLGEVVGPGVVDGGSREAREVVGGGVCGLC